MGTYDWAQTLKVDHLLENVSDTGTTLLFLDDFALKKFLTVRVKFVDLTERGRRC